MVVGSTEKLHDRCMRCGRKLKNADVRIRGYGNVCFAKIQKEKGKRLFGINKLDSGKSDN